MTTEPIWATLIASLSSLVLAYMAMRSASSERRDARAERIEMAKLAKDADGKLDQIHGLVNSDKTEGLERELASKVESLVLMREVITLNRANDLEPSADALTTIQSTEARITELRKILMERAKQTAIADKAVAA